jgi:m7GpppX diphosphatase
MISLGRKWDRTNMSGLYLQGLVHRRDLKSLRDLRIEHLGLLKKIRIDGSKKIEEKYGLEKGKLRVLIHYQPSYCLSFLSIL